MLTLRERLLALRDAALRRLDESDVVDAGLLSVAANAGALLAIEAEATGEVGEREHCRPVITDDGKSIWLATYAGPERLAVSEVNPRLALGLARDLIGAALTKLDGR